MFLDDRLKLAFAAIGNAVKGKISSNEKGVANGVATLDGTGKVPSAQLPSYIDDVLEYATLAALPATGESGKIYVLTADDTEYRWSGTAYRKISKSDVTADQLDNTDDVAKAVYGVQPDNYEQGRTYKLGEVAYWPGTNEIVQTKVDNVTAIPYGSAHTTATSKVIPDTTAVMGSGRLKINGVFVVSDTRDMSYDQFVNEIKTFGGGTVYSATVVANRIVVSRKDGGTLDEFVDDGDNTLFTLNTGDINSNYWKVAYTLANVKSEMTTVVDSVTAATEISKAYAGLPVSNFTPGRTYKLGEVAHSVTNNATYQTIVDGVTTTPELTAGTVILGTVEVPDTTALITTSESITLNGTEIISDTRFMSYDQVVYEITNAGYVCSFINGYISISKANGGSLLPFAESGSILGLTTNTENYDNNKWRLVTPIGTSTDNTDYTAIFEAALIA